MESHLISNAFLTLWTCEGTWANTSLGTHPATRIQIGESLASHRVTLTVVLDEFADKHEATALLDHQLFSDNLGENLLVSQHVVAVAQSSYIDQVG